MPFANSVIVSSNCVEPFAGVIKPQAAFFELLGPPGMAAMQDVIRRAKEMGFVTILDAKRGDIASTATAYADAAFGPVWDADALTVNPYLGEDAGRAVRRGGAEVQARTVRAGADEQPRGWVVPGPGVRREAALPARRGRGGEWNAAESGVRPRGRRGAVVGATHPTELKELRNAAAGRVVPGPGVRGPGRDRGGREGGVPGDGLGAVVNSSRGVTFPFHPDDPDWESKIVAAAQTSGRPASTIFCD